MNTDGKAKLRIFVIPGKFLCFVSESVSIGAPSVAKIRLRLYNIDRRW